MRRLILGSLVAVALIAAAVMWVADADVAYAYVSPGTPTGFVNDFARVLTSAGAAEIESELVAFNASTSNEISVVTVPSMQGDYIENYAARLFQEWGIGKAKQDNGVLVLLAIEERELRIEVGYGLEGALPDSVAQRIINAEMTPKLKAGDYDGAVRVAVTSIEAATRGEYSATQAGIDFSGFLDGNFFELLILPFVLLQWLAAVLARSKSWWAGGVIGVLAGFGVWYFIGLSSIAAGGTLLVLGSLGAFLDYLVSKAYGTAKSRGSTPPWWAGGSGGGRSSGGFGGFGGGSSGGGGASGRW